MNDLPVLNVATTVAWLSVMISVLVERARSRWPNLDGDLVVGVSWVLATAAAWGWNLTGAAALGFEGLPTILDYIATGFGIAGVAGWVGTAKNVARSLDPRSSIHREPLPPTHLRGM
jgi:hypothetical protein